MVAPRSPRLSSRQDAGLSVVERTPMIAAHPMAKLRSTLAASRRTILWERKATEFVLAMRDDGHVSRQRWRRRLWHGPPRARRKRAVCKVAQAIWPAAAEHQLIQEKLADMIRSSMPRGCSFIAPQHLKDTAGTRHYSRSSEAKLYQPKQPAGLSIVGCRSRRLRTGARSVVERLYRTSAHCGFTKHSEIQKLIIGQSAVEGIAG